MYIFVLIVQQTALSKLRTGGTEVSVALSDKNFPV